MNWDEVRAGFPVLERYAYLNAGTNGPLARTTGEAAIAEERRELEEGRGGVTFIERVARLREEARDRLARLIRVAPERVALTSSTTGGCNIVLGGLDLRPEDEVVTTDAEHFGLLGPLGASRARVRVAAVQGRPAGEAFDAIRAAVTPRTRLIALSHVTWTTGHVLPVRELKEATGLPLLVDGAQSAGAVETSASPFDFYTVSAQKWPCGPNGIGALYVADPERLRIAAPSQYAQQSFEPAGTFVPRPGSGRFDTGWHPGATLAGTVAALDAAPEGRFEQAAEMARRCRDRLAERFDLVTEPGHATLVTFRIDGDAAEATRRALEQRVVVRDVPRTNWLRASCGYWTNDDDIERLVEALAA